MCNPFSYIGYQFQSSQRRTELLLDLARQDEFYGRIVDDLCTFGFDLRFPVFGGVGQYLTNTLIVENADFERAFIQELNRGRMRASFALPPRYGRDVSAHLWLHELTHFCQDMHGLFLEPLSVRGEEAVLPCVQSYVAAYLFCEAMAEIEALRGSLRLREDGFGYAWRGALRGEWRALAKLLETEGAAAAFRAWYKMPQRAVYESRALYSYRYMLEGYEDGCSRRFVRVPLSDVVALLPEGERPDYVAADIYKDGFYTSAQSDEAEALQQTLGAVTAGGLKDMKIGSTVHLWHKLAR